MIPVGFADECALILQSIADGPDDGVGLYRIAVESRLPACQVVDLIETFLKPQIDAKTIRVRGIKSTVYARKAVGT